MHHRELILLPLVFGQQHHQHHPNAIFHFNVITIFHTTTNEWILVLFTSLPCFCGWLWCTLYVVCVGFCYFFFFCFADAVVAQHPPQRRRPSIKSSKHHQHRKISSTHNSNHQTIKCGVL